MVRAVDDVSFTLDEGETIGLVGESGCGKTTTCLSIVGLLPSAARIVGGSIGFAGQELTTKGPREMRRIRGRQIAMILQDPMVSLNPLFSIYTQVAELAYYHQAIRAVRCGTGSRNCCGRSVSPHRGCACASIRIR